MITVGLVKELYFIASHSNQTIGCDISYLGGYSKIHVTVCPSAELIVAYKGQEIWREEISSDSSMFGIESCDTISRIIVCIDNGTDWSIHKWQEKLDHGQILV